MKILIKIIVAVLIVLSTFSVAIVEASQTVEFHKRVYTPQEMVNKMAMKYKVSAITLSQVIKCESGFDPNKVGDHGTSFGLVQIHLPAHPTITKEQALDPFFSAEFIARSFAQNKQSMWSCYNMLSK